MFTFVLVWIFLHKCQIIVMCIYCDVLIATYNFILTQLSYISIIFIHHELQHHNYYQYLDYWKLCLYEPNIAIIGRDCVESETIEWTVDEEYEVISWLLCNTIWQVVKTMVIKHM